MKKREVAILILFFCNSIVCRSIITFEKNGGRLGDNLLSLSHALWLSLQYDIQLYIPKFNHSDEFHIHDILPLCTNSLEKRYDVVRLGAVENPVLKPEKDVLYVSQWRTRASVNWQDEEFVAVLKKLLTPRKKIKYIEKPADCITVALHIRMGGGFSFDHRVKHKLPQKFPPFHFYVDQLERLIGMYPEQQLYVYIFTDDDHPGKLQAMLQDALRMRNIASGQIRYEYRERNNRHDANVLDDFFNMMEFDVLIRPQSGFSMFAQRLSERHSLIIAPKLHTFISSKAWKIDTVSVVRVDHQANRRTVTLEPCNTQGCNALAPL